MRKILLCLMVVMGTLVLQAANNEPKLMKRSGQKNFLALETEEKQQYIGYWPSADYLKSRAVMGSIHGGIKSIGDSNDSPGSELLIRLADEDDPRPIYVAAWGISNVSIPMNSMILWPVCSGQPRGREIIIQRLS